SVLLERVVFSGPDALERINELGADLDPASVVTLTHAVLVPEDISPVAAFEAAMGREVKKEVPGESGHGIAQEGKDGGDDVGRESPRACDRCSGCRRRTSPSCGASPGRGRRLRGESAKSPGRRGPKRAARGPPRLANRGLPGSTPGPCGSRGPRWCGRRGTRA